MNYYERHLGDYAKDTAHLSMLEHGAYGLLLDRYYATEQGIPADQAHRVARARTKEEKAAVDAVLAEFFTLTDGLWRSKRADQEIEKAQTKIKAAQENGKRGGRPRKNPEGTQEKPSGFPLGSVSETQEKAHQTPDTKHQTPITPQPPTGEGFARFWSAWPSSPRKAAREQCERKWHSKGCEAKADAVVAAVEAWKASADWAKDGGAFIPAPLVWLNQARWEALPSAAPASDVWAGAA